MISLDSNSGLPFSEKQIASIVESENHRINIWSGAVRAGKTIASIVAFFIGVQQAPQSGLILICGRTLQTIERNIIEPMQDPNMFGTFASAVQHTRGSSTANILGRTVHLIGASDVRAEGKLRGLTACLAMVDEATLLPEEFWTQLLARLSVDGARLFATTNPSSPSHFLKKKFIDRRHELDVGYWSFLMEDNPALSPKYVADTRAELTGVFLRRNFFGEWIGAEGSIYDMFDPSVHVVKHDELPQMKRIIGTGIDYGVTNPTTALVLAQGEDNCLYVVDEWCVKTSTFESSWSDAQLSAGLIDWLNKPHLPNQSELSLGYTIVDPSAKSLRRQLKNDGLVTRAAVNDVINGISTVSSLISRNKLKISDKCVGLLEEFPDYRWDPAASARGEDKPIKIDDHFCDSVRYVCHTTLRKWWRDVVGDRGAPEPDDESGSSNKFV